jgi:glutathione-regulated potassium-efflux system protein KefB
MAMAGFLLGMVLSESDFRLQVEASILPLKGLFMALFFVAVGMSIDLELVRAQASWIAGCVVGVIAIKVAVMALLGRVFRLDGPGAARAAALLTPCSEFGFVLFATTKAAGLIGENGFAVAVVVVSITMALTPLVVNAGYWLAERVKRQAEAGAGIKEISEELTNHVVVAGYGRAGRLMCLMLKQTETPYIAFDLNPERIADGQRQGHHVHYGDVADPHMQGAAAFAKARSVVVTLETLRDAERLVGELRQFYPHVPIQLAAPDLRAQDVMRRLGVADVVCTSVEGNLQLGEAMLRAAGVAQSDIEELAVALRQNDYALLRDAGGRPDR